MRNRRSFAKRFHPSRLFRGEKPVSHPIRLTHRRIFIIPTKRGIGFLLMIMLILLIAFVYNNNLAYFLAFLLGSIFFVTIFHCFKTLSNIVIKPIQASSVFAGQEAGYTIQVCNSSVKKRYDLKVAAESQVYFALDGYEHKTLTLYQHAATRGRMLCNTITISSSFPFGMLRAWAPLRFTLEAMVFPKPSEDYLPLPEVQSYDNGHLNKNSGKDDFVGIKVYQAGDSVRQIHWKAYAKGQGLFSKEYAGDAASELWLNFAMVPGVNVEDRLRRLCRWVIDAEQKGLRYGLHLPQNRIKPGLGSYHRYRCLEALALY